MTLVNLVGVSASDPIPGNYIQVNFGAGPAGLGNTVYSALLYANKLSSGTAGNDGYIYGPDTETPLNTESDAISLFGFGSEAHLMWLSFNAVNKSTPLYVCTVAESSGNKATGTITLTGTATGSGTLTVYFSAVDFVEVAVNSGDSADDIGDNLVLAVNAKTLGFIASNNMGTVTLTARQKGTKGNFFRYSAKLTAGTGVTVTPTARTNFSGGTVNDSLQAAIAAVGDRRFYYQVSSSNDASNLGYLKSAIDSNALPGVGSRNRAVYGFVDGLAANITLTTAINDPRFEQVWLEDSDVVPSVLAARAAGAYMLFETSLGALFSLNFNGFGSTSSTSGFWLIPAPIGSNGPSTSEIRSALMNGITPIKVFGPGVTCIVRRVTTKSLNGTSPDYRTRDACIVTVCDRYADDLKNQFDVQLGGRTVGNDPAPGQLSQNTVVVTPRVVKNITNAVTTTYTNQGLLENPFLPAVNQYQIQYNTQVVRETNPDTTISVKVPLAVARILVQTASDIDQV